MESGPWLLDCSATASEWLYEIRPGTQLIGRGEGCDVHLSHPSVSRRHAQILVDKGTLQIHDLQSSNGTFVNDSCIVCARFVIGDYLRLGHVTLEVVATASSLRSRLKDNDDTPHSQEVDSGGTVNATTEILTPADAKVFTLLLEGFTEKHVSEKLHLAEQTIHWHVKRIYRQLGVHSRSQLIARFLKATQGQPDQRQ